MSRQISRPRLHKGGGIRRGFDLVKTGLMLHGGSYPRRFAHVDLEPAHPLHPSGARRATSQIGQTDRCPSRLRILSPFRYKRHPHFWESGREL